MQKDIIQQPSSIAFIKENWATMGNKQMAAHLGVCVQYVRQVAYANGLYRMKLEYWTKEQIAYLIKMYKLCGDKELAEIFQTKWPKEKGWTLKHIEKKRNYLNLHRSKSEIRTIKKNWKDKGIYIKASKKAWATRGVMPEGTIVNWNIGPSQYKFIKVSGVFIPYYRHVWLTAGKQIPKGYNVIAKPDVTEVNTTDDLECISNAELARRNSVKSFQGLSDNYVAGVLSHGDPEIRNYLKQNPKILQLKRNQLLLNRTINSKLNPTTNGKAKSN